MSYEIDQPLTEEQARRLLDELCIRLGLCLPPNEIDALAHDPPRDARVFADQVFTAEGMAPEASDIHLWRQVRDLIFAHFNNSIELR